MKIILEEPLKEHMGENGLSDLVVEAAECIACGGGYLRAQARFADEGEALDPERYESFETELGHAYVERGRVVCGASVRVVWKSYYWLDGLGVAGVEAVQES